MGFFNPVMPNQIFAQSRYNDDYFWHFAERALFHTRILPAFCFEIPTLK